MLGVKFSLSAYSNILSKMTERACFSLSVNEPRISSVPWFFFSVLVLPNGFKNEVYTCVAWLFLLVA